MKNKIMKLVLILSLMVGCVGLVGCGESKYEKALPKVREQLAVASKDSGLISTIEYNKEANACVLLVDGLYTSDEIKCLLREAKSDDKYGFWAVRTVTGWDDIISNLKDVNKCVIAILEEEGIEDPRVCLRVIDSKSGDAFLSIVNDTVMEDVFAQ